MEQKFQFISSLSLFLCNRSIFNMCVCFLCFLQRYMWRVLCHFFYTTNDDWKEGVCNRHKKKVKENANQLQEVWEEECDMETNIHSHQGQKTFQSAFATFPGPTACRAFVIQIHFFLLTPHFTLCYSLFWKHRQIFNLSVNDQEGWSACSFWALFSPFPFNSHSFQTKIKEIIGSGIITKER